MRDPNRIDPMIEQLREAWKANPDMRLTQLVLNACGSPRDFGRAFNQEDEYTSAGLEFMTNRDELGS